MPLWESYWGGHVREAEVQVLQLPGIAGLHVMPVSKAGRKLAMQLAAEKLFTR